MTSSEEWGTHAVEFRSDVVVKRFPAESRGQCEREWRALTLLADHAPGLAPAPMRSDLAAEEPLVVMERLPGEPLRRAALDERQLAAFAAAVSELHAAVPSDVLAGIPLRPARQQWLVEQIHEWTPEARPRVSRQVGEAMDLGLAWLADSGMEGAVPPDVPRVFGAGDGNLANYLWDGTRVRIVDFEDSGSSDRPFELAEITEHVGSWVGTPLDAEALLDLFDLTHTERARLPDCRRLLALVWLFLLSFDDPRGRNPSGTAERQATRLVRLLGQPLSR